MLPSIGGSITPLKTPPITPQLSSLMNLPSTVISPLAPDTPNQKPNFLPLSESSGNSLSSFESLGGFVLASNMQPLTSATGTVSSFGSFSGGNPIYSQAATASLMHAPEEVSAGVPPSVPTVTRQDITVQEVEMSSSSDESGSESDDEQSDSDEQSSAEEEEEDKKALLKLPLTKDAAKLSTGSSVSSAPFFSGDDTFFFQGGNSGGFFGDDLMSRLQGGAEEEVGNVPHGLGSEGHWLQGLHPAPDEKMFAASNQLDGDRTQQMVALPPQQEQPTSFPPVPPNSENLTRTPIPPASSINTPHQTPATLNSLPTGPSSRPTVLPHQHSLDDSGRTGKKRKLERQSSLAESPSLRLQPLARKTPRISTQRRDSSLSSFSVSSVSSSDSSESSDEQSDAEHPQPLVSDIIPTSVPPFPPSSTSSATSLPSHPPQDTVVQKALVVRSTSQLEAGELEDEEVEEKWEEGEIVTEVRSLWVKIPLEKVDFQREQKPKVCTCILYA